MAELSAVLFGLAQLSLRDVVSIDDPRFIDTNCENCGSIDCSSHITTERLEGTPVCTGCAVTKRLALKTKCFYDEDNLEAFREEYDQMSVHEKTTENKPLAAGSAFVVLLLTLAALVSFGVV